VSPGNKVAAGAVKTAFVFVSMPVGGAEDFALTVFPRLGSCIDARFVCLRELGKLGDEAAGSGWPVELVDVFPTKRISPAGIIRFAAWLKREGIRVVHSQTYHAHIFCVAAAMLCGVRVVVHQQKTVQKLPLRKRMMLRWCMRRADCVLALSEQTAGDLAGAFGLRREAIHVVPNAIDGDVFKPAADREAVRRRLGLPEGGILIGSVASLHPVKNHALLIKALADCGRRDVRLVFIGDGPTRAGLEEDARRRGVADNIIFAGHRRPVAPWMQSLDAFVLASTWEGQPLALLQAVSCGLPILASRIEGNTAVLGEDHEGLFDPADSASAARLFVKVADGAGARFLHCRPGWKNPTAEESAATLTALYKALAR